MNAYYKLLRQLAILFGMLTLFTLPLFFIYSSYSGLADQPKYFANRFAIGNMGKWPKISNDQFNCVKVEPTLLADKCHPT